MKRVVLFATFAAILSMLLLGGCVSSATIQEMKTTMDKMQTDLTAAQTKITDLETRLAADEKLMMDLKTYNPKLFEPPAPKPEKEAKGAAKPAGKEGKPAAGKAPAPPKAKK